MPKKIYLAGPDVFLENAIEIGKIKKEICRRYGFEGLFPLDNEVDNSKDIFEANCVLMENADIGVFNLSPFRGPSADVGTIFELGFIYAKGKPVFGYSNTQDIFLTRTSSIFKMHHDKSGFTRDEMGYSVENFDLTDNLMIHWSLKNRGDIFTVIEKPGPNNLAALGAFEKCISFIPVS